MKNNPNPFHKIELLPYQRKLIEIMDYCRKSGKPMVIDKGFLYRPSRRLFPDILKGNP